MLGSEVGLQAILFHSPYAFIEITNVISETIDKVLYVTSAHGHQGVISFDACKKGYTNWNTIFLNSFFL